MSEDGFTKASQSSLDRLADTMHAFIKRLDDAATKQVLRGRQPEKLLEGF